MNRSIEKRNKVKIETAGLSCLYLMVLLLSGCAIGSPIWNATIEPLTGIHAAETQAEMDANQARITASAKKRDEAYRELQDSQNRAYADVVRAQQQNNTCMIHFQDSRNAAVSPVNVYITQDSMRTNFGNGNDFKISTQSINRSKPLYIHYTWNGKVHIEQVSVSSGGIIRVTVK